MMFKETERLYSNDVTALEAWEILSNQESAQLVDVRTQAEWHYVGKPDLRSLHKNVLFIEWRLLPSMELNSKFAPLLSIQSPNKSAPLLFLCRTGIRSQEAAIAATALGYKECYNIAGGFEGELNEHKHRGHTSGWKASKLAWLQD
jgi:rhodanese-related sulfurtransferase